MRFLTVVVTVFGSLIVGLLAGMQIATLVEGNPSLFQPLTAFFMSASGISLGFLLVFVYIAIKGLEGRQEEMLEAGQREMLERLEKILKGLKPDPKRPKEEE